VFEPASANIAAIPVGAFFTGGAWDCALKAVEAADACAWAGGWERVPLVKKEEILCCCACGMLRFVASSAESRDTAKGKASAIHYGEGVMNNTWLWRELGSVGMAEHSSDRHEGNSVLIFRSRMSRFEN
jgi:hypothetical protein